MPPVKKIPYYTMEPSLNPFSKKKWTGHYGNEGCVPLNTQQTVSLDRLAPGESPPPPKPKPTREQVKAQKEEAQKKKQAQIQPKEKQEEPEFVDAEECEDVKLPVFDLQDIPIAMDKIGWPVSAKFARKWFASPKHIYNDKANSVHPLDDTTVTLDWALKFGNVKKRLNELLSEGIYDNRHDALTYAKEKIINRLKNTFIEKGQTTNLSFNTTAELNDIRQFHIDWQFQLANISSMDTLDGLHMTDLTGSLANCNLYAAIGNVDVSVEKYFKHENGTSSYCIDPVAEITHVYVYIKDNYSFNDKYSSSQYLGHWNKRGIILGWSSVISDITNTKYFNTEMGNSKKVDFFDAIKGVTKPIDIRRGIFGKYRESDVFYPIHNRDYNQWREKHNHGGDFMIYTKPKYFKLKKPVKFELETICQLPRKM